MIEEDAYVTEVASGQVWVEKNRQSTCSACQEACPSSLASKAISEKSVRLAIQTDMSLSPGDKVVIGVSENALAKGSLFIYILPLLGFFAGASLGRYLAGSDMAAAFAGIGGLALCYTGFKALRLFDREGCQPVILRKID